MRIRGKRIKWEPGALFAFVMLLGIWLALGPDTFQRLPTRDDATLYPVRIADSRGVIEKSTEPASGMIRVRIVMRDGFVSDDMTIERLASIYGPTVAGEVAERPPNWIFRRLNITSWASLVWIGVGFGGQLAFSGRMLIQWWVSERRRESHVPVSFWWWSLIGAVMLFSYFIWRQDPVGVLGQCTGLVVYARNLRLISKKKRRLAHMQRVSAAIRAERAAEAFAGVATGGEKARPPSEPASDAAAVR
jgi:lipid-A-disaccharide synthase-like uncharacterized protein